MKQSRHSKTKTCVVVRVEGRPGAFAIIVVFSKKNLSVIIGQLIGIFLTPLVEADGNTQGSQNVKAAPNPAQTTNLFLIRSHTAVVPFFLW